MTEDQHLNKTITSLSHLQRLRAAVDDIKDSPILTQGTWNFPKNHLILWYKDKEEYRRIEFPTSDVVELERLSSACQPATFGKDKDHVLDETYRRARKMDVEDFAINMGFNFTDFLNHAVRRLLGAPHDDKNFRAELYKLNVYGPGSFFKPHRDTPRADDMFGSLIIALPTKHEGGSLILRDEKNELVFESSQNCTSSESGLYSVPWAAFWSQIEHEVAPVISGYRVTLTFNLYFSKVSLPTSVRVSHVVPDASPLFTNLKTLLDDATFLPQGGLLGFGLEHQYPMSNTSKLQSLMLYLKGTDSFIVMTAQALGLKAYLRTVYDIAASDQIGFQSDDEGYSYRPGPVEEVCQRRWLMKCKVMYLEYFYDYNRDQDDTLGEWMRESLEKGDTFFVNRGFLNRSVTSNEIKVTFGEQDEAKTVTTNTKIHLCDLGTEFKKLIERRIDTENAKTGQKTSVVEYSTIGTNDPQKLSDEDEDLDLTRDCGFPPLPGAVVVNWIRPMKQQNAIGTPYAGIFGNTPALDHIYGWINLIVEVPPFADRVQAQSVARS